LIFKELAPIGSGGTGKKNITNLTTTWQTKKKNSSNSRKNFLNNLRTKKLFKTFLNPCSSKALKKCWY